ncbi:BQ5605_C028g10580 [Microbotryum silenes-dioicae]|uniref:BQ5605_C028g10580 protein n=1 Tax=Microbotryum silenes-dioicae TaxID=796604 RepID=A0A2X0MMV1_9BASI|nr:BQ5605_C028g10580 [Microbotryum silenes-dioicae]
MIKLGPRANPAGAATGNKNDANDGDGDDESVASTESEGGESGEEMLTRATMGLLESTMIPKGSTKEEERLDQELNLGRFHSLEKL